MCVCPRFQKQPKSQDHEILLNVSFGPSYNMTKPDLFTFSSFLILGGFFVFPSRKYQHFNYGISTKRIFLYQEFDNRFEPKNPAEHLLVTRLTYIQGILFLLCGCIYVNSNGHLCVSVCVCVCVCKWSVQTLASGYTSDVNEKCSLSHRDL